MKLEKKSSEIGFPLLLKPLMSSSGKGQSLVNRKEDLLLAFKPDKNELFPNQSFCFIPLVIEVEIAPRKKKPIITQRIRSKAIEGEKPCPDLIISERGSKGSKITKFIHIHYISRERTFY